MKQLLIVAKNKALNYNISSNDASLQGLDAGAITFFDLKTNSSGSHDLLAAAPTDNFGIALGRPNSSAFVIPEVDINSLTVSKALPTLGKKFKRKFTFPTPVVGKEYSIMFIKKATVPHERNTWHCDIVAGTTTAATEAGKLKTVIESKLGDIFTVSLSSADLTIEAKNIGDEWEAKLIDGLSGVSFAGSTDYVDAIPNVGDKKYVQELASKCAAGKGFNHTYGEGKDYLPGYPEAVEDLTPNTSGSAGASTEGYVIYTLRFAVHRDSAKTRDEVVNQVVHIAVPISNSSFSTIDGILMGASNNQRVNDTLADHEERIETLEA